MERTSLSSRAPRVAIVHDWLTVYGGAERVLEQILSLWPEADVYSIVDFLPESSRGFLKGKKVETSFLQKWPKAKQRYRSYLPLMTVAVEQFDLSSYDLIISSSFAVAKGVITGPDQTHISYVHSPIRYAWDLQHAYLKAAHLDSGPKGWIAKLILHYMRMWDYRTAHGVDAFMANSEFIGRRIKKVYGRDSAVVYPPVDVSRFKVSERKEDFYLTASRLVEYKHVATIVKAFKLMPDKTLVVIGDGPEFEAIKADAPINVKVLGFVPTEDLVSYMGKAKAFVFAAEEDFGIAPVEAQACGTPVIAFGKGGALETVIEHQTGQFFYSQTPEAIAEAVSTFEQNAAPSSQACRSNAERFSVATFQRNFSRVVSDFLPQQFLPRPIPAKPELSAVKKIAPANPANVELREVSAARA